MDKAISPAERAFQEHVGRPEFELGLLKGQWRLVHTNWPQADFAVMARDGAEWGFRFQLDGYPGQLPNARPWNIENGCPLAPQEWPKGSGRFAAVFNPSWNSGALYLPCDRLAFAGHDQWVTQLPELLWQPARGIIHYLEIIHELLNSFAYCPPVREAA
jgi:hypothetical protein